MATKLDELGVIKKETGQGCNCSKSSKSIIYTLPIRIDLPLGPIIENIFGKLATSFEKTGLLKVHRDAFIITAVRKLKQIRFTIRKEEGLNFVDGLEKAIIEYMKG